MSDLFCQFAFDRLSNGDEFIRHSTNNPKRNRLTFRAPGEFTVWCFVYIWNHQFRVFSSSMIRFLHLLRFAFKSAREIPRVVTSSQDLTHIAPHSECDAHTISRRANHLQPFRMCVKSSLMVFRRTECLLKRTKRKMRRIDCPPDCVHLPWKFDGDCSYDVWMRTFLLFFPLLLLRNELFVGTLLPLLCSRDSDDVDDEKDDAGVAFRRRGSEPPRGASLTFNFTLNIVWRASSAGFQCQQVVWEPLKSLLSSSHSRWHQVIRNHPNWPDNAYSDISPIKLWWHHRAEEQTQNADNGIFFSPPPFCVCRSNTSNQHLMGRSEYFNVSSVISFIAIAT